MSNPTHQHKESKTNKALHKILRFTVTAMLICASYLTAYVITEANLPNLPHFITTSISISFMVFTALILSKKTRLKTPRIKASRPAKDRNNGMDAIPATQALEIVSPAKPSPSTVYSDEYGLRGIYEFNHQDDENHYVTDSMPDYYGVYENGANAQGLQCIQCHHRHQSNQANKTHTINRITINTAKFIGYSTILLAIMTGLNRIVYG